jgi:hypothetical protein
MLVDSLPRTRHLGHFKEKGHRSAVPFNVWRWAESHAYPSLPKSLYQGHLLGNLHAVPLP